MSWPGGSAVSHRINQLEAGWNPAICRSHRKVVPMKGKRVFLEKRNRRWIR